MTVMHAAAKFGFSEVCASLLEKGALVDPVDAQGRTPLHFTALYGHAKTMNLLLEKGGNLLVTDLDGSTVIDPAPHAVNQPLLALAAVAASQLMPALPLCKLGAAPCSQLRAHGLRAGPHQPRRCGRRN